MRPNFHLKILVAVLFVVACSGGAGTDEQAGSELQTSDARIVTVTRPGDLKDGVLRMRRVTVNDGFVEFEPEDAAAGVRLDPSSIRVSIGRFTSENDGSPKIAAKNITKNVTLDKETGLLRVELGRLPVAGESWVFSARQAGDCSGCNPKTVELAKVVATSSVTQLQTMPRVDISSAVPGGAPVRAQALPTGPQAIAAKYSATGGATGPLGASTSSVTAITGGYKQTFKYGIILWTSQTGAFEVHGAIYTAYQTWGLQAGALGFPVTDETTAPDGIGKFNYFQFGAIYYTPSTGAHVVYGDIVLKWGSFGWETGFLGYPTSDSTLLSDGVGVFSDFQGGSIVWTAATGSHEVHGAIRAEWANLGWEHSPLGYPLTDETGTPDGIGRFNHFQAGSIYFSPTTSAHEVHGAIHDEWAATGWELGPLGYPTTDETGTPDEIGRYNHFQYGSVYWTPSTGAHEVHGLIHDRWANLGWERSRFGYPTSDEMASAVGPGARVSLFQHGAIYWSVCGGVTNGPPNCTAAPGPGQCRTDADCVKPASCNNPWSNAFGTCTNSLETYAGDAKGHIDFDNGLDHNSCVGNPVLGELFDMGEFPYTEVNYDPRIGTTMPPDNKAPPRYVGAQLNLDFSPPSGSCLLSTLAATVVNPVSLTSVCLLDLSFGGDHVQGLGRIPGYRGDHWLAATVSNTVPTSLVTKTVTIPATPFTESCTLPTLASGTITPNPGRGGIYFIEAAQLDGMNGESFRQGLNEDRSKNRVRAFYETPSYHPGGLQIIGETLATAAMLDDVIREPVVYFYDVSDPVNISANTALYTKVPMLSRYYPSGIADIPSKVSGAAVVKMADGGYLMAVNNGHSIWLFLTQSPSLRSRGVHWYFHNYVHIDASINPENINFVTQCDGKVYLLATSNNDGGALGENGVTNEVNSYELFKNSSGKLDLVTPGYGRGTFKNDSHADFRAAGNFYVSPQGEVIMYGNSRSVVCTDRNFRFAEYVVPTFCGLGGC